MGFGGSVIFHGTDHSSCHLPASLPLPLPLQVTPPAGPERRPKEVGESLFGKCCGRDLPAWASQTGTPYASLYIATWLWLPYEEGRLEGPRMTKKSGTASWSKCGRGRTRKVPGTFAARIREPSLQGCVL